MHISGLFAVNEKNNKINGPINGRMKFKPDERELK